MEQRGTGRGGEENKQPLPQPQPQPPRPRLVQRMAALMRASLRPPPPPPQRQLQPPPPPPPPRQPQPPPPPPPQRQPQPPPPQRQPQPPPPPPPLHQPQSPPSQRQPQPPPPPPQLVQSLAELMSSSLSTADPSTAAAAGDSGLNQLLSSCGSGENQGQLLDKYVHDYMIKRGLHKTAEIFRQEAGVSTDPIEIDEPDGFLKEWWSIFYDMYASRETDSKNQETK